MQIPTQNQAHHAFGRELEGRFHRQRRFRVATHQHHLVPPQRVQQLHHQSGTFGQCCSVARPGPDDHDVKAARRQLLRRDLPVIDIGSNKEKGNRTCTRVACLLTGVVAVDDWGLEGRNGLWGLELLLYGNHGWSLAPRIIFR